MKRLRLEISKIPVEKAKRLFNNNYTDFEVVNDNGNPFVKAILFNEKDRENVVNKDFDAGELREIPAGTITEVEPTITIGDRNLWYLVGENDYVYISDNSVEKSINKYFSHLSYVNEKSDYNLPEGVRKRFARATSRYNLPVHLIDGFGLKEDSLAHAAYMIDDNKMVIVPEYFTRMGVVRVGGKLVGEFSKTVIHETGHVIWHRFLSDEQKALYVGTVPKFFDEVPDANVGDYVKGYTDTLTGKRVFGEQWTHEDDKFLTNYARMSVKEDFAETFLFYVVSPDFLLGFDKERYDFINSLEITDDIDRMNKGSLILPEKQSTVEISDLISIDLQTSEFRRKLAKEFETVLDKTLNESQIELEHIVNLVPFGSYVRQSESIPEDLKVGIYALNATPAEVISGNIKLVIYKNQESLDNLIYEQRVNIQDTKMKPDDELDKFYDQLEKFKIKKLKGGWLKINKGYYKKEEIERWITTPSGKRIPIPKEGVRGRKSRKEYKTKGQKKLEAIKEKRKKPPKKVKRKKLPLGHIERKPSKKKVKLSRPRQTVYSVQRHFSEVAPEHRDLRLKIGRKAYSWAVPEWPKPGERSLAIMQPAHSAEYMKFRGTIRSGYGAGRVDLEDYRGVDITDWSDKKKAFNVYSGKNKGRYALIHIGGENYLLVRKKRMRKELPKEYIPARPRKKFKESMWKDENYVAQPKMNGARYLMYVGDGENRLMSRAFSKKDPGHHVEQTDVTPHLRDMKFGLKDMVLDGEIFVKDKYTTSSIMNSSPIRARKLQKEHGLAKFYVFDILRYNNNDLRNLPYKTRLKFLDRAIGNRFPHVKVVPSFKKNKNKYYKKLVKQGWEGIVLKDLRGKYNDRFMTKMKPVKDSDFVIMGWTPGKGKYKGMFGSIIFGKYNKKGRLIRVGKVGSGFSESDRAKISKLLPKLKKDKTVIAIKHLGLSHKGVPEGPVFDRLRSSKTWHDLLLEARGNTKVEYEGED